MTSETTSLKTGEETARPGLARLPESAEDIMTKRVVSVPVGTPVREVATLLLERKVSAVPVLGPDHKLVGMVSDGDLIGRNDDDRVARRDWWLTLLATGQPIAQSYAVLGARPVEQIMRAPVLTIDAAAPLHKLAEMFAVYDVKRLPVLRGDEMVGIVSRSDLARAAAAQMPAAAPATPLSGLMSLFTGMMQTYVRPEDTPVSSAVSAAAAPVRPPITAGGFRHLVSVKEQAVLDVAVEAKEIAALGRLREIKAMLLEHLDAEVWSKLLDRAQAAAASGENTFELIKFPCDLCSDGGRKIDVAESDWPTTLRGEAAEIYTRWERELRPGGFRLRAQISDYVDGIPSMISLSLAWANEEKPAR